MKRSHLLFVVWAGFRQTQVFAEKNLSSTYPLKQRDRKTQTLQILSLQEAQSALSWSDDSDPKSLQLFGISLFSTDGNLPEGTSIVSIQTALNRFILAELNAAYGWGHQVKEIKSKVLKQSATATSRRFDRALQTRGSTLDTLVSVTFKNEPSPSVLDVWGKFHAIMSDDLTFLLSNLTLAAAGDVELANVDSIYYIGPSNSQNSPVSGPTSAIPNTPTTKDSGIVDSATNTDIDQEETNSKDIRVGLLVSVITASCVLIAAAALFTTFRRNTQHVTIANSGSVEVTQNIAREIHEADAQVNLFWDGDSDIFSVEAALIDSPHRASRKSTTFEKDLLVDSAVKRSDENASVDQSDIFSGIDAEAGTSAMTSVDESPRSGRFDTRSVFSFLSGFASRGEASTVVHSNVTKSMPNNVDDNPANVSGNILGIRPFAASYPGSHVLFSGSEQNKLMSKAGDNGTPRSRNSENGTPRSRVSSLFTFSEEGSTDLYSSGDENEHSDAKRSKDKMKMISTLESTVPEYSVQVTDDDCAIPATITGLASPHRLDIYSVDQFGQNRLMQVPSSQEPNNNEIGTEVFEEETKNSELPNIVLEVPPVSALAAKPNARDESASHVISEEMGTDTNKISSSPSEVGCFDRSKDRVEVASRWNIFLPDFNSKADKGHGDISSPVSLIHVHSDSNLSVDEGYDTDPGPSATRRPDTWLKGTKPRINSRAVTVSKSLPQDSQNPVLRNFTSQREENSIDSSHSGGRPSRRHTKNPAGDGTNTYQNDTMGGWSLPDYANEQDASLNEPDIPEMEQRYRSQVNVTQIEVNASKRKSRTSDSKPIDFQYHKSPNEQTTPSKSPRSTPKSAATNTSSISGLSAGTTVSVMSETSANKQLISDLVWLEKKINATTTKVVHSPRKTSTGLATKFEYDDQLKQNDSLSFVSDDVASATRSIDSASGGGSRKGIKTKQMPPGSTHKKQETIHSIICRDCYAPPGKLKIVIHSTKDGPAVHTVKRGSSLEGHIFPGDLIISVDNVDTRSYSAEQVMKMMTAKTRFERKITVLHFEEQEVK